MPRRWNILQNHALNFSENSKNSKDVNKWTIKFDIDVVGHHLGKFDKATKIVETAFITLCKFLWKHAHVANSVYHF
jgi:hypothetical protein